MIPVTKLNSQYGLFIDGAWRPSADGKTFDSFCPATGDKLASCAEATSQDVDAAVDAAWKAFATWKKTTVKERATLLNKIADIIDAHTDELALIETLDNGKPIRETKNIDVPLSAAHFRYFAGCILAEEGSATMLDNTTMSIILREPIGVVGQIVPWNFPFLMAAWKLAPVLASGCCTVKDNLSFRAVLCRSHQGYPAARCLQRHHGRRLESRSVHARPQGLLQTGIHRLNGSRSFRC